MGDRDSTRYQWRRRPAFAEIAEALHVQTDEVMAAQPLDDGAGFLVLYSTETHDPDGGLVHRALLERDGDGVLRRVKHATVSGLAEFMAHVEEGRTDA